MNIAVFASGRGSNFQAILNAIHQGYLPAHVTVLISNKSDAGASEIARAQNIPAVQISQTKFSSEDAFAQELLDLLRNHQVELIALAGYLKRVPSRVVRQYRNHIVNIHPALLPAFGGPGMYGHRVHEAVLESGAKVSGATVHIVDEEYDRGPIVMQQTVAISDDETPDSLATKVLTVEHEIYPRALKAFAEKRIHIEGRKVWVTSSP
ncbi:MAG: phosphoribosylglycinamide formyltransferase [Bacteroidota bacterium]